MKKVKFLFIMLAFIALSAFTVSQTSWKISNGYSIKFSTDHASGKFEKISGTINFDEANLPSSSFNISVDVSSIATGFFLKNSHAKGSKWFDAEKYPTINFISTKFSKTAQGYLVDGNLTMHGITKQIQIPFTFSNNSFSGNFSVNRMDYQVGTMEGMSKKVGNKVDLEIVVPVSK
jgi:polyisoprenoid-binding protein YceI